MATVTEILNRAGYITGHRADGIERTLALQSINNAYSRAVMESECKVEFSEGEIIASGDLYNFVFLLGNQPYKLVHVAINESGNPLQQVSFLEMQEERAANPIGSGTPYMYSTPDWESISFYPNPSPGDIITAYYVPPVPELVETAPAAGQETTPSMIPAQFHWDVLLPGTVLEMMDKDSRAEEAGIWAQRYTNGVNRMQEWMGQFAGTANRAFVSKGRTGLRYNDQRRRL